MAACPIRSSLAQPRRHGKKPSVRHAKVKAAASTMRSFVVVLAVLACAYAQSIDECLQSDSISCVQKSLYRKAKEFFERDSFELVTGVSLVKASDRSARSGKDLAYEQEIDQASGVAERQSALENFIGEEVTDFFGGRSLRINFAPALEKISESARAISQSVPSEISQAVDEVVEGRGKKQKLKKLLPLLLIAKAKIGALATLAYFAIALIAKKAIVVSLISIAISAFIGLRGLWDKKSGGIGHDSTGYSAGGWASGAAAASSFGGSSGGWSSGGSDFGNTHGGYDVHSQAYSGYH